MKIRHAPPIHLTYCLNVHPGESWPENLAAIAGKTLKVRDRVGVDRPFGLGLRLSRLAAGQLARPETLGAFRRFLRDHGLYVFTINGFPYGSFHAAPVKTDVYRPDWRRGERRDYTIDLADILAGLMDEGLTGSISTVPGSYGQWIRSDADVAAMAETLADVAAHLHTVRCARGKEIVLALEPEPDCYLEDVSGTIGFLTGPLAKTGAARLAGTLGVDASAARDILTRHIGVCLDTAHLAVKFEDLADGARRLTAAGVRVGKVQLSSALQLDGSPQALAEVERFNDAVYLHQVSVLAGDGTMQTYPDLPDALADPRAQGDDCRWRVHFHVPLHFTAAGALESTAELLDGRSAAVLADGLTEHIEIETYTYDVLPEPLRPFDVIDGIAAEYGRALKLLGAG